MKLTMPKGFAPPKNARPDESFEAVATICPCKDGTFSLTAIDGVKLPEEGEEEPGEMEEEDTVDPRVDATGIKLPFGEEDS